MSNNKTVPLHYYRPLRKSFMETCEQADFHINTETIKIPFVNILSRHLDSRPSDNKKPHQKNQRSIVSQTTKNNKNQKNRKQILNQLSAKEKSANFKFTYISKQLSPSNYNIVKSSKFTKDEIKKLQRHKSEVQYSNRIEESEIKSINDRYNQSNRLQLPPIKFKQIKDISNKKQSIKRFFKREKQQIATKMKKLKNCYGMQVVTVGSSSSLQSQRKRMKTQQQIENQFILERILTIKPSKQLDRETLNHDFKKHQYYKQVRQKKNTHRSLNHKSVMRRSKTINMADHDR